MQFKAIQDEGKKIMNSVVKESENADKKMKNVLDELDSRAKTIQDKLARSWRELMK